MSIRLLELTRHMLVIGTAGSGKTNTLRVILEASLSARWSCCSYAGKGILSLPRKIVRLPKCWVSPGRDGTIVVDRRPRDGHARPPCGDRRNCGERLKRLEWRPLDQGARLLS
ncbi:helicase HerA domain-containing protein [Bradyrhizobium barranii]|uniref:DUF87 domain-containing protein n=1 Tax=Bradyrhizobium barranii subsp. barranii TaxID=2823807 RepID=A0A7Z0QQE0_9BRAD|nr:DUF87 domain-containing protein [Bradyrhizobium barranii]